MKEVIVRGLMIGREADCKICVPIVGTTEEEIINQAGIVREAGPDLAELRIDYYEQAQDLERTKELLHSVREEIGALPLIFTLRTKEEGGELSITKEGYKALLMMAAQSGSVDLIDVELNLGEAFVEELVRSLKLHSVSVIISNHDFSGTKDKEELIDRMRTMQRLGADIAKIAMTPHSAADVLCMLEATNEMSERFAKIPLVTMSMGRLGALSRISGNIFGSSITFASVGRTSAPGQMALDEIRHMMEVLAGEGVKTAEDGL